MAHPAEGGQTLHAGKGWKVQAGEGFRADKCGQALPAGEKDQTLQAGEGDHHLPAAGMGWEALPDGMD